MENEHRTTAQSKALSLQRETSTQATAAEQVSAILAKLALHYWRPDFTPNQQRLLFGDFLRDLQAYSPADISLACDSYRRDGANKFFPTPGALLAILKKHNPAPSRLANYQEPKLLGFRRATKSVAEILREKYGDDAARKWEARGNAKA